MCGIIGVVGRAVPDEALDEALCRLRHRGPDDRGIWRHGGGTGADGVTTTAAAGTPPACLGFRRLAILDPAPRGNQPMAADDGRHRLVFNGEIYNFRALRTELEGRGHRFRTETDSEVLLAGYRAWGADVLERVRGMFAFAVHDRETGELFLARDRMGIKPLYLHEAGGTLSFASEVKALLALPWIEPELDREAAARFFTFLWVPDPDTLFRDIRQLEPGTAARFRDGTLETWRWWQAPLPEASREPGATSGGDGASDLDEAAAVDELDRLLRTAVEERLVSDVPLGAFLSGGVDSSLIVALMRAAGADDVSTQTVVFPTGDRAWGIEEPDAPWARRVRDHFGDLDYHEQTLAPDVADLLPRMVWHLDDPVADPAAIATYLISRAAKERATVMLAGMGAEELFAGYPRHRAALLARRYRAVPRFLRKGLIEPIVDRLPAARPGRLLAVSRRAKKFVRSAELPFEECYLGFAGYYHPDELDTLLAGGRPSAPDAHPYAVHRSFLEASRGLDPVTRMTHLDLRTFLPNLNLAYTDRASMAASVEVRVPFLDHRVVELVGHLPADFKLRGRRSKHLLKEVAGRYLPADVVDRPKAGFQAPVRAWVNRDLKPVIRELLAPARLRDRGVLDPDEVWRIVEASWAGREDHALRIWAFLTFELWATTFLDGDGSSPVTLQP